MNLKERIAKLKKDIEEKRSAYNKHIADAKLKVEADDLQGAKDFRSKAEAVKTEMDEMRSTLQEYEELAKMDPIAAPKGQQRNLPNPVNFSLGTKGQEKDEEELQQRYKPAFLNNLRGKRLTAEEIGLLESKEARAMSGLNDEDGGLVIPQDISTAINQLKATLNPLEQFVRKENVTTRSGSRVLEKRADMVPFQNVAEMGNIPDTDNPKFTPLSYAIKDYAGKLPLSNTLLQDSDQNLQGYVVNWFAKKSIVTRNSLILSKLQGGTPVTFDSTDDIKTTLNVTLDPAIALNAKIITNQNGYNYLDQLKDAEGKYLLQPIPTNPTQKMLFGYPVVVVSNKTLPNISATVFPIFIGDFQEGIVLWDRQQQSIATNPYSDSAWNTNTISLRAIEREDVTLWDDQAFVYGQIDVTPAG
ncbi:phage major capsid protein [Niallia sp. 03091]|uniref:phage major capsid protein n=1 Tax=Niallia sp. 03091 TaxID=3458059 RepID=UPI0040446786